MPKLIATSKRKKLQVTLKPENYNIIITLAKQSNIGISKILDRIIENTDLTIFEKYKVSIDNVEHLSLPIT